MTTPWRIAALLSILPALLLIVGLVVRQPVFPPSPGGPPRGADPKRLEKHVRFLAEACKPRDVEHPANLDKAAAYIKEELKAAGGAVSEQVFVFEEFNQKNKKVGRGPFRNVIAVFGPETLERIVVGAHYDAFGEFPAADDNASGTAGLLELARLLGQSPPPLRVELVAYSTEEPPYFATEHMGSARHAESLKEKNAAVRAMISLEMIGYFSDEPGSQKYPIPLLRLYYPGEGNFITVVGRLQDGALIRKVKKSMQGASPLAVYSIAGPRAIPGIDYSDQLNYWDRGYPAVMVNDTAFYRNLNYHTPKDTPERLDYKRMAEVVEGVFAAVGDLWR